MNNLLVFFLSFIITEVSTPYLIKIFKSKGIVDKPSSRKVHSELIPRMGGIIIYSVVIIIFQAFYQDINSVKLFLTGSVIIFLCGIIDDFHELNWKVKFGLQSAAVIFLMLRFIPKFDGVLFFGYIIPDPLGYILLFFFMVGTINSINLMDGLDGLASGFSILTILFIGFLGYYKDYEIVVIISTALLGTLLSFLKYNSYPAKIFLGDSGSLVLGYFLVFLSIEILRPFGTKTLDLTFPVLLLGVPIIDTLKVMYLRMREGRLPFTPDKKHLHHVIFGNNIRHKTTVFIIHTLSIGFMLNALFYLRYHNELTYLIFFLMGLFLISIKKLISLSNIVVKIIKDVSGSLFKLPSLAKDIYTKLFIPLSIISFVLLILLQFRYVSVGASKLHLAMLATGITLFTTAVYSFKKTNLISPIYVFFNILFYLTFNYFLKEESRFILADIMLFPNLVNHFLFYFLAFVVLVFLMIRYSLLPKEEIFLSGMDLTLLSIAMLFFIVQPLSQWDLTALNYSLIVSLVVYIWFKIVQYYFKRTSMFLYFGLFLVNFIILGVSYIV